MDRAVIGVVAASLGIAACGGGSGTEPAAEPTLEVATAELPEIPVLGTDSTLDVGTWNLEWFGDRSNGPSPEGGQLDNVWTLLDAAGVDVWAVQEVAREYQFCDLVAQLEGYDGLLAIDSLVVDGAANYSDFAAGGELKVGLVYRSGAVTVDSARIILTGYDHEFAGRPPMKVHLTVGEGASPVELVVIVLHAKAGAAFQDRTRRLGGSEALMTYLEASYASSRVLVLGDFNDDVDTSIVSGYSSPYANFVDSAGYAFPTAALSETGASSTVFYDDVIDHHLATDEVAAEYVASSAQVVPAGSYLARYPETTSDHFPVVARYAPPGGAVAVALTADHVRLTWSDLSGDRVDIYRDGALLVTTANDDAYIDTPTLAGAAVTYRVCEAETDTCTPDASFQR